MSRKIVPVSVVVKYLKTTLDNAPGLHGVMIEGEISNLRKPFSGHWYFSIKDDSASLSCVMFASYARNVSFPVNNGDKVVLTGDISVYVAEGRMQMIAKEMKPSGVGDLYLQLEALKKKLSNEGLFDASHKKLIPSYAQDIALVTGNHTAAREDVLITFANRWPMAKITEYPAPVQGADAAPKIIAALQKADQGNHQIIILARGGGSLEDLWCFNDESLARCIYALKTPIITGIGHEIDTTLADYVSDVRANTPTGAVQAAVPDYREVLSLLNQQRKRLIHVAETKVTASRRDFQRMQSSSVLSKPERLMQEKIFALDHLSQKLYGHRHLTDEKRQELQQLFQRFHHYLYSYSNDLHQSIQSKQLQLEQLSRQHCSDLSRQLDQLQQKMIDDVQQRVREDQRNISNMITLLDAYSPLKILQRGYSLTYDNGNLVNDVNNIHIGDEINVRLSNGSFVADVKEIKNGAEENDI